MPADILDLNEKMLGKLPPERLTRELMRLPAKRRLEVILDRADSEAVVAALDANDFFFTVQEIGADDSLPLLALGRPDQIDHLFDIEWWRKDAVEPARALTWLDRLARAGGHKLLEWLYHVDFELLVTLFRQWIDVAIAPEDVDLLEARDSLPPKTIDDVYFWESKYPQFDDLVMLLMTTIFEVNYGFFKELMNQVLYGAGLEMEEEAYRFHKARLEDNAIPDYYDALEIYRAAGPNEFRVKKSFGTKEAEHSPPSFALALVPEGDLLGRVLREIDDPELAQTLQMELASLSNKVLVADQLTPDSARALREAVEKALAYVNLGLEIRSGGSMAAAGAAVEDLFLEDIFRLAQAEIAKVSGGLRRMVKFGWLAKCPGKTRCLDAKWFDAAEELLAGTPKLLRSQDTPGSPPGWDFFRTPRDLVLGSHTVRVIEAAGELYEALDADPAALAPGLWPEAQVRTVDDITVGVMVFTAAAQLLHAGKWACHPLPVRAWPRLFPLLKHREIQKTAAGWIHDTISDPEKRRLAGEYIEVVLRNYETEMKPFSEKNPPEPQLVSFFMFEDR